MIHLLLQESNYTLSPDEIYKKPKSVKHFIYASLDLTMKERKKNKKK